MNTVQLSKRTNLMTTTLLVIAVTGFGMATGANGMTKPMNAEEAGASLTQHALQLIRHDTDLSPTNDITKY